MHYKALCIFILATIVHGCVPVTPSSSIVKQETVYSDHHYIPTVGLSQLYPSNQDQTTNPVAQIAQGNFILKVDLLEEEFRNLNLKYIHCNQNWKPSNLMSVRFLDVYNEFSPVDYRFSANTMVDFVNYSFEIPVPKMSGNYLLVVSDQTTNEMIISKRALVFENSASINFSITQSSVVSSRRSAHELDFSIQYDKTLDALPLRDFNITLLQNHNWTNRIEGLQPSLMRIDQGYLEYDLFDGSNSFPAGNEFRFFDISSIDFRGMNINTISKYDDEIHAFVIRDKPRNDLSYTQINGDNNGGFILTNNDLGEDENMSEYVQVHFELKTAASDQPVYVTGRFNSYQKERSNRMSYDAQSASYKASILLKQGIFDYMYAMDSNEPFTKFEGNFFETENEYEILVYYKNPINSFDQLIGYTLKSSRN